MTKVEKCVNMEIFYGNGLAYFSLLPYPPEESSVTGAIAAVEIPSELIFSCAHAAKALEEALRALSQGKALKNFTLEVFRRLTVRRQAKSVEELLKSTGGEKCYALVTKEQVPEPLARECRVGGEQALKLIFGRSFPQERAEEIVISYVALTYLNRWLD